MPRKKLQRFAELKKMEGVFEYPEKGEVAKSFGDNQDLVLEVGCGAGDYTVNLAEKFPDRNFVGIDLKGDRVWRGAKKARGKKLENVAFIRGFVERLEDYFEESEVAEIWITFPDPHPKPSKWNQRLGSGRFMEIYKKLVKPGGLVHLKTDNLDLFDYCVEEMRDFGMKEISLLRDIHKMGRKPEFLNILTFYERKFMDEGPIYYACFQFSRTI